MLVAWVLQNSSCQEHGNQYEHFCAFGDIGKCRVTPIECDCEASVQELCDHAIDNIGPHCHEVAPQCEGCSHRFDRPIEGNMFDCEKVCEGFGEKPLLLGLNPKNECAEFSEEKKS
jgi:hypothetical protein